MDEPNSLRLRVIPSDQRIELLIVSMWDLASRLPSWAMRLIARRSTPKSVRS